MNYDPENIFSKIISGKIPCDEVYSDEHVLAFRDASPVAPVHVLVIPKGSYISFDDFLAHASPEKVAAFFKAVQHVAKLLEVCESGYRLVTNHGKDASQTVPHFHVHIIAGKPLGGLIPGSDHA